MKPASFWCLGCVADIMCGCHKTFLNAGVDVDIVLTLFQTLTGKEIEIDIEPTDKVKYDLC